MNKKQERWNVILSLLSTRAGMAVSDLASKTAVSEMTIRRDLAEMQEKGYITLVSGVAILNKTQDGSTIAKDYSLTDERLSMMDAKRRIGALACSLLEPNDTVALDTGTTSEALIEHLPKDIPLTILCYNLNTLLACQARDFSNLIFAGGFYHKNTQMFESPEAVSMVSRICIDKYFCSAAGINKKGSVTCIEQYELPMKEAALKSSMSKILVVDSTKFGKIRSCLFADIANFDMVITDKGISAEWLAFLDDHNIKYMLA